MLGSVSQRKLEYSPQKKINMLNMFTLPVLIQILYASHSVRLLAVHMATTWKYFAFAHVRCVILPVYQLTCVLTTESWLVCVHMMWKAAVFSLTTLFLFCSKSEIFISILFSESLGVFNNNTLSSVHVCAQMCVCAHRNMHLLICLRVCACCFASASLQFISLSGKDIAEGDKQTHLTLCPHGNQGTEQKRDGGRDRKPERGDANRCSGMKREGERGEETRPHTPVYLDFSTSSEWLRALLFNPVISSHTFATETQTMWFGLSFYLV